MLKMLFFVFLLLICHSISATENENFNTSPKSDLSSLVFIFDVTGSMSDELSQVKSGALKILRELSEKKDNIIHNYILIPFNDPRVGPTMETTNVTIFDTALQKLTVGDGDDCPEMSLTAINEGLRASLPNSFVFVFTDAGPKDSKLLPQILSTITEKHSQVIFILTGFCDDQISKEYQEIASISNGQIFDVHKRDIEEVLNFIKLSIRSRRVDILAVESQGGTNSTQQFDVSVDNTMNEIVISLSGKDVILNAVNPSGRIFNDSSSCSVFLSLSSSKMCSVENPESGIWKIIPTSMSPFSLRTSATSNITFSFGFEIIQVGPNVTRKALCQPLEGVENIVIIKLNDSAQIAMLTNGEIILLNGLLMKTFPLKRVKDTDNNLYIGSFTPINSTFHLQINGETKLGFKFQRITPLAINPYSDNTASGSTVCTPHEIEYLQNDLILNKASLITSTFYLYVVIAVVCCKHLLNSD